MESKPTNFAELSEKILLGIKEAVQKLIESSAAQNKSLVIGDEEGNIKKVPAKELLDTLQK